MCWLTMSFAGHEIVSSKFQGIPRSFASRTNIDFSVSFRAVDFIRRHTSRLKGFIYKLIKELNFGVVRLKATGYVYDKSRFINALYSHKFSLQSLYPFLQLCNEFFSLLVNANHLRIIKSELITDISPCTRYL